MADDSPNYEAIQELYDQGLGRNQIMKQLGMTRHAVDKACKVLGIKWDGVPTTAVRVRSRRAAVQRAALAEKLRNVASELLDNAGQNNFAFARERVTAAAIAIQRELEIATHIAEHGEHKERTPEEIKAAQQRDDALALLEYLD